jgi:hypothetical protein
VQIIRHKTGRDGAMGSRKETTTEYGTEKYKIPAQNSGEQESKRRRKREDKTRQDNMKARQWRAKQERSGEAQRGSKGIALLFL